MSTTKKPFQVWEQNEQGSTLVSQHYSWKLATAEAERKSRLPFNHNSYGVVLRTARQNLGGDLRGGVTGVSTSSCVVPP